MRYLAGQIGQTPSGKYEAGSERYLRFLTILGYSLLCAVLLSLFSQIQDLLKYLFSLGALYMGVQFFKRYEEMGMRIAFVISTIVLYFLIAIVYAMYLAVQSGQMPPSA
jgi:uncharacterized membrane protein YjjP (DUF1212 family)